MKLFSAVQTLWPLLFLLAGCSVNRDLKVSSPSPPPTPQAKVELATPAPESPKGTLFVLLSETDGKTGSIRVTNAGGSQILDRPGDATRAEDFNSPPMRRPLDEEKKEVAGIFRDALAAQPDLSSRFVSFILWFENDKCQLSAVSKETLPDIMKTIKTRKPSEIHIVGHTDRVGTESYNLKLSSRRATFVRNSLISKGIKSRVLFISSLGESRPLVHTEDEIAEPLNRRVEVMIR